MSDGFVKATLIKEVPPGTLKTYAVKGKHVLLVNVADKIFAIGVVCNHRQ